MTYNYKILTVITVTVGKNNKSPTPDYVDIHQQ